MLKVVEFSRRALRTTQAFLRTRNLRWARAVVSSNCSLQQIRPLPGRSGIWLADVNLRVQSQSDLFLLHGYDYVRRLHSIGGRFKEDVAGGGGLRFTLGNLNTFVRTWDDLYILNEIYIDGAYRLVGAAPQTIIDIGANVGHATLYFANQYVGARIVAFEPVPETFERLSTNLDSNPSVRDRVQLYNFGLADRDGTATVEYSDVVPGRVGLYALPEDGRCRGPVRTCEIRLRESASVFEEILSESGDGPTMLKVDCEGAEYQIIQRLHRSGALSRMDYVLMEWHRRTDEQRPQEICEVLHRNGFVSFLLGDIKGAGGMLYAVKVRQPSKLSVGDERGTSESMMRAAPVHV